MSGAAAVAGPVGDGQPRQVLYRAEIATESEEASLRLVLRWWRSDRFELSASDFAGRSLWKLQVDGVHGRLDGTDRDDRCGFDPAAPIDLPNLRLPIEAKALPRILDGGLPVRLGAAQGDEQPSGLDEHGRRWETEYRSGRLVAWRLLGNDDDDELSWSLGDGGSRLECPERSLVVAWRERTRSVLRAAPPVVETGGAMPACRDRDPS